MAERPVGVTLLAILYGLSGLVLLVQPFYPWPAWQAPTIAVAALTLSAGFLKILCLLLGAGLLVAAFLLVRLSSVGLYLALVGLVLAVVVEVAGGRWGAASIDGLQVVYFVTVRDRFTAPDGAMSR